MASDNKEQVDAQLRQFQKLDNPALSIEKKLDELIALLQNTRLDSHSARKIRNRFDEAVRRAEVVSKEDLKPFEALDKKDISRADLLDNLETLLSQHQLDSTTPKKLFNAEKIRKVSLLLIALVLIVLGFAMIIMPAPHYFEMFTIFYFSPDDGVTLMDLISLLIVFTGVYLFITSIIRINTAD